MLHRHQSYKRRSRQYTDLEESSWTMRRNCVNHASRAASGRGGILSKKVHELSAPQVKVQCRAFNGSRTHDSRTCIRARVSRAVAKALHSSVARTRATPKRFILQFAAKALHLLSSRNVHFPPNGWAVAWISHHMRCQDGEITELLERNVPAF